MRALIVSIALLATSWAAPTLALADASVRDGVLSQCAATSYDGATCDRLARIAGELVDSENVSDALAEDVANLPADQGEWLAQALDAQARAAEAQEQGEWDVANAPGDRDVLASSDDYSMMGEAEPPAPPPPPQPSDLLRGLRKASDYVRRVFSGRR